MMTRTEFFEALRKTPRTWYLDPFDQIRSEGPQGEQCPVSSILRRSIGHYIKVGKFLGLSLMDIGRIADASDQREVDPVLRMELESACGITAAQKEAADEREEHCACAAKHRRK